MNEFDGGQGSKNRDEIMNMLNRREKDNEELELESVFSELRDKAGGAGRDDEIDSIANQSLTDLKEMQEMQGLYKGTPKKDTANVSGSSFYKPAMPPSGRRPSSKLGGTPQTSKTQIAIQRGP